MLRSRQILPVVLLLSAFAHANPDCEKPFIPLVTTDSKLSPSDPKAYRGLSKAGIEALKKARKALKSRSVLFENEFRGLSTVDHAATVARIYETHMFIYGPPGGAKSGLVNFFLRGEPNPPFKLQLHQMITEQALIGGQDFEAAKRGIFKINTEGSLASYHVALFDEIEKANPGVLALLLTLLNEKEVLIGGQTVKAQLESLFSTSNANLPEFVQQFVENGQGSTAPALLNRFPFKAFVYNWLPLEDQKHLDDRRAHRTYLKALARSHPAVLQDEVFLNPEFVDWETLRELALATTQLSELSATFWREITEDLRAETIKDVRASQERHHNNPLDEPFVYMPSADLTERLREQMTEVIIVSTFLDLLKSPIPDEAIVSQLAEKRLELDPLSIWRAYLSATTIGPGRAHLQFDPANNQQLDIDYGWPFDPSSARDLREEGLIKNIKMEQERFRRIFLKHLEALKREVALASRFAPITGDGPADLKDHSLEVLLMHYQQKP